MLNLSNKGIYLLFYVFNSHGVNHGRTYRRYAYRYNAKKERGTSMEVFARNENHKGAMMNVEMIE